MKTIAQNKKAFHDYEILDRLEAGIALVGSEVKSIRAGRISLKDSFVEIHGGEAFLLRCHISPYEQAGVFNHEPERKRKLLLHGREIHRLDQKVKERGFSIVPLQAYFSDQGRIKIEIALVRGKREYEKKQKLKERDIRREMDRDVQRFKDRKN
jgi:SsrA-binding protein